MLLVVEVREVVVGEGSRLRPKSVDLRFGASAGGSWMGSSWREEKRGILTLFTLVEEKYIAR